MISFVKREISIINVGKWSGSGSGHITVGNQRLGGLKAPGTVRNTELVKTYPKNLMAHCGSIGIINEIKLLAHMKKHFEFI